MDLTKLTDEQLIALRDETYAKIVELQGLQAAISHERTLRLKVAEVQKKRGEVEAAQAQLRAMEAT